MKNMIDSVGRAVTVVLTLAFVSALFVGCGPSKEEATALEKKVYSRAVKAYDPATAINAAYRIVLLDPTEKFYYDSIAELYYTFGNYVGAIEVVRGILSDHSNVRLYEILAYSEVSLGNYENASLYFQDLIALDSTNQMDYLYEMGACYFNIENYESAFSTMKKIMSLDASRMAKKSFTVNGKEYQAYYYVAALNMMGYIYIMDNRFEEAEALYKELFNIDPDFPLAQNNYALLQSLAEQSN